MKQKLLFIIVIWGISLVSYAYAENQVPKIILDQKIVDWKIYRPQNDTSITISSNGIIKCPPVTTKLIDWRLSSKEEAQSIAASFIKNSEDKLGISFNDLKLQGIILSVQPDYDYHNPSATAEYKQYYNEIPVFDSKLSVNVNAYGTIWSVKSELIKNITAPTTPIISSDEAKKIVRIHYSQTNIEPEIDPELYIFSHPSALHYESKANKLVYRLSILSPVFKEIFIDSQTGEILLERSNARSDVMGPLIAKNTPSIYKDLNYNLVPIMIAIVILSIIFFVLIIFKKKK